MQSLPASFAMSHQLVQMAALKRAKYCGGVHSHTQTKRKSAKLHTASSADLLTLLSHELVCKLLAQLPLAPILNVCQLHLAKSQKGGNLTGCQVSFQRTKPILNYFCENCSVCSKSKNAEVQFAQIKHNEKQR